MGGAQVRSLTKKLRLGIPFLGVLLTAVFCNVNPRQKHFLHRVILAQDGIAILSLGDDRNIIHPAIPFKFLLIIKPVDRLKFHRGKRELLKAAGGSLSSFRLKELSVIRGIAGCEQPHRSNRVGKNQQDDGERVFYWFWLGHTFIRPLF